MSTAELINKGLLMGTIHVLTGPDHLSALATLSATDVGSRSARGENNDGGAPKNWKLRSFLLGVRWGVGHSFGLLVVGGILIGIQAGTTSEDWIGMNNWVPTMLETFVGVFMLVLGSYGVVKALRNRRYMSLIPPLAEVESGDVRCGMLNEESVGPFENRSIAKNNFDFTREETQPHEHRLDGERIPTKSLWDEGSNEGNASDAEQRLGNSATSSSHKIVMSASEDDMACGKSHLEESEATAPMVSCAMMVDSHLYDGLEDADDSTLANRNITSVSSSVPKKHSLEMVKMGFVHQTCFTGKGLLGRPTTLALLAGVIHGTAGPGGVLGVMPAVEMRNPKLAIIYLGTFCVTSTIVMGGFASLYGTFCKCLAVCGKGEEDRGASLNRVFLVEFVSACLSICVGIVWLTLQSLGKLDEVFP